MDSGLALVGVLVFVGFIGLGVFFLVAHVSRSAQETSAFARVAQQLKGSNSSYGKSYSVFFRSDNVSFQIRGERREQTIVRVSAPWKDRSFRMKLFPEVYSEGLKKFLGMEDIKIGSPDFDRRYVIQSNDETTLVEVLNPEVQSLISRLSEVNLTIVGGEVFVEQAMPLDNSTNIVRFAQRFVTAYFAMINAESLQLELRYVISDSATCMVCGSEILTGPVKCLSCQTPHHEDCWNYMGKCSTYGCGQANYHRAG